VPTAANTCRIGWCKGFEQLGIPYILLSVHDLERRLPELPNPICWISESDYLYLDRRNLAALSRCCPPRQRRVQFDRENPVKVGAQRGSSIAEICAGFDEDPQSVCPTVGSESRAFPTHWNRAGAVLHPVGADVG
jgi:hypothetical protein